MTEHYAPCVYKLKKKWYITTDDLLFALQKHSTKYNKDSPISIGGEMNCKQENERQWRAERNRYLPLT